MEVSGLFGDLLLASYWHTYAPGAIYLAPFAVFNTIDIRQFFPTALRADFSVRCVKD